MDTNADVRTGIYSAVEGLFADIFAKATVVKVDPLRCISINKLRVRPLCSWAIKMFKRTISGHSRADTLIQGVVSTGKFSILVPVPEEYRYLVIDHFIEQGKSETEARNLAEDGAWYHVVDGGHMHQTIVEAVDELSEKFGGFRWPVVKIEWQHPNLLRAIARMCQEMQKETHMVDFTLPNVMHNLREVIDTHHKDTGANVRPGQKNRGVIIKDILEFYTGGQGFANNTLRTVCGIVLKHSTRFVTDMRTLLTEECEEYCERLGSKKPFEQDCRIYKRLLSTQSLRGARLFFDDKRMTDEDRVNVIYRLRFIAREKGSFKAFQCADIETQAKSVINAREEINKFSAFLGDEIWPPGMENLRCNMLQTTLLDENINEFDGDLLPAIVQTYIKATGVHGTQKLGQFRRRAAAAKAAARSNNKSDDQQTNSENDVPIGKGEALDGGVPPEAGGDCGAASDANAQTSNMGAANNRASSVSDSAEDRQEDTPENFLEKVGVQIHRNSLLEFERNSTNIGEKFDFILCDPFQKVPLAPGEESESPDTNPADDLLDDKGVTIYLQCCRRLLTSGGICFYFLDWSKLHQWYTAAISCQFVTICDPFVITKNPEKTQNMKMKGLQTLYDMGMVLRKPGSHPDKFEIDKTTPYVHIAGCGMPRWCNIISQAPQPHQRLTFKPSKAQVRPGERACKVVMEVLQTFCPVRGRVLDPKASVLTTGLACVSTERECVLLETDERCLSYAIPRLEEHAKAKVANEAAESLLLCHDQPRPELVDTSNQQEVHVDVCEPECHQERRTEGEIEASRNGRVQRVSAGTELNLNVTVNGGSTYHPSSIEEESERRDDHCEVDDAVIPYERYSVHRRNAEGWSRTHNEAERPDSSSTDDGTGSATIGQGDYDSMSNVFSSDNLSDEREIISPDVCSKPLPGTSERNSPMGRKRRSFSQSLGTTSAQSQSPGVSRRSKRTRKPVGRSNR